jgi:hypothetical protein
VDIGEPYTALLRTRLTDQAAPPILCSTMPRTANTKEIAARSTLSGRPVGLMSAFAISLLGLLLLLAR